MTTVVRACRDPQCHHFGHMNRRIKRRIHIDAYFEKFRLQHQCHSVDYQIIEPSAVQFPSSLTLLPHQYPVWFWDWNCAGCACPSRSSDSPVKSCVRFLASNSAAYVVVHLVLVLSSGSQYPRLTASVDTRTGNQQCEKPRTSIFPESPGTRHRKVSKSSHTSKKGQSASNARARAVRLSRPLSSLLSTSKPSPYAKQPSLPRGTGNRNPRRTAHKLYLLPLLELLAYVRVTLAQCQETPNFFHLRRFYNREFLP